MSFNTIRDLASPAANSLKDQDLLAIADFDTAITYKISVHELMQLQQAFSKDVKGLVPGPTEAEMTAKEILVADGNWRPISYFANSKTAAGVVSSGGTNAHTVWMTDANGNPAWRSHRTFGSGYAGLVPGPTAAEVAAKELLSADGTWRPLPTTPVNTATVAGIVSAPGTNEADKVWKTDSSGTPAWRESEAGAQTAGWNEWRKVEPAGTYSFSHDFNTSHVTVEIWVSSYADGRYAHRVQLHDYDSGLEMMGAHVWQNSPNQITVQLSKSGFAIILNDGQNSNNRYDSFTFGFWIDAAGRVSWENKYINVIVTATPNPLLRSYPYYTQVGSGTAGGAGAHTVDLTQLGNYSATTQEYGSYVWFQVFYSGASCEEAKLSVEWGGGNPYGNQKRLVFLEGGCASSLGPAFGHLVHQLYPYVQYESTYANYSTTFNGAKQPGGLSAGFYVVAVILPYGHLKKLFMTWSPSYGYGGKLDNPCHFYEWDLYFFKGVDIGRNPRTWADSLYKADGSGDSVDITHHIPIEFTNAVGGIMPHKTVDFWVHGGYRVTPADGSLDALDL